MRIQFNESVAGANFSYRPGEIADLRPDIAKEFLRAGQAVKAPPEDLPAGVRRVKRGATDAETTARAGAPEQR